MDTLSANLQVLHAVTEVSLTYGARAEVSVGIYRECVAVMLTKFQHLAPEEILEAFRANAAGEIDTKGRGEMYGGEFNASNFTAIISAFAAKRKIVVAAYSNAKFAAEAALAEEQRRQAAISEFEESLPEKIRSMILTAESWEDCPAYLFASMRKRGLLDIDRATADEILVLAQQTAISEAAAEKMSQKPILYRLEQSPADRAKVIARQMSLWQIVVMPGKMANL